MVCEFKFVCYGHIKKDFALYVTKFKFEGPLKSEVSFLQIVNLEIFQFSIPNNAEVWPAGTGALV